MNPRIRELIEQSMEPTGVEGLGGSYQELNPEKFAELIIRECADQCTNVFDYHAILNRFGVEE